MKTAAQVLRWFDANWPNDLQWPAGIARPGAAPAVAPLPAAPPVASDEPYRPGWWDNLDLRVFLTAAHDRITMTEARAEAVLLFSEGVPSLAEIHRYWQHLDALRDAALRNAKQALA